jgi:DNA helicase-2/ATP-dependent DNA helicase PcrA
MKFTADFHIHSHFSLATSGQLIPEHLDRWGRIKGVKVVGTGDFTHPGWLAELRDKLEPAEQGLFKLRLELKTKTKSEWDIPETEENSIRFLLTAEVSCIYKKDGRVRKVHNVIFAPDFEAVERIQRKLKSLNFNITSDGRPILGMDCRDLLELALEASEDIFFVPAHIWTPWFSALGDKSGFDRIDECYADLSGHIHAVESGLSSDPAMNDLCSHLDRYSLISNSDAHSPEKLGREANRFDTELTYAAITSALRHPDPAQFQETLEFFPQEGKYHLDGHRKCGISWEPEETLRRNAVCPVCGRRITVGVLHRVHQLSDRNHPDEKTNRRPFRSMIPLIEILSEIHGSGKSSKAVVRDYAALVQKLGSEIGILLDRPIGEVQKAGGELTAEAVRRMRAGEVFIEAGYDGEYGRIRAFREGEIKKKFQTALFAGIPPDEPGSGIVQPDEIPRKGAGVPGLVRGDTPASVASGRDLQPSEKRMAAEPRASYPAGAVPDTMRTSGGEMPQDDAAAGLNPDQKAAAEHPEGPALVLAGPGTGKTAVLTRRAALLVRRGVTPDRILVITFTNKAAEEIRNRISAILGDGLRETKASRNDHAADGQIRIRLSVILKRDFSRSAGTLTVSTFHSFGHSLLKEHSSEFKRRKDFTIFDEDEKLELLKSVVPEGMNVRKAAEWIRRVKQDPSEAETSRSPEFIPLLNRYESLLQREDGFDFDDLIEKPLRLLKTRPEILQTLRTRFSHILLDEFQDLDGAQYETVRLLAGGGDGSAARTANLWAVGDPDQSIYGFRGASPLFIRRFQEDFPGTVVYPLVQSYRCTDAVLRASEQVIRGSGLGNRGSKFGENQSAHSILNSKLGTRNSKLQSDIWIRRSDNGNQDIGRLTLRGTEAGVKIQIIEHPTDASEAEFVARTIESMSGGLRFFSMDSGVTTGHDDSGLALSDFAVLCRIGKQMDSFEKAFHDHGIPYQKSDIEPFYRREPVRSVTAVLKAAVRQSSSEFRVQGSALQEPATVLNHADWKRIAEEIGKETVRGLIERIIATEPAAADPGHRHEMEELLELAEPFGSDVNGFIQALSLGTGMEWVRPELQAAALMTLHAAKGLEFSCVFIPGCEDGLLPYRMFERLECDPEEERRLLYVGMTRAKHILVLSHAGKRFLFGRELHLPRSPFLDAIEEDLVERGRSKFRARKSGDPQMDLF